MVEITTINESDEHGGDNDWNELMGEDLMMKKLSGDKSDKIEPQEAVLVTFEGRIADDRSARNGPLFQRAKSWLIVVGDSNVVPALEMGIRHMKVGQTALIWSHSKFALGNGTRNVIAEFASSNGLGVVPPKSNVMYKVTVTQKVMDTSRLNPYFTIQKALTKKNIANDIYQNEWCKPPETNEDADCEHSMKRAIRLYTKAAKEMETLLQGNYFHHVEKDHPQEHESRQILLDALNNIVAVHLRQKEYHEAKISAVEVLKIDPNNTKALLRAAKAALMDPASTMEEAAATIEAAKSAITTSGKNEAMNEKEMKRLKIKLKEKQVDYKEKTKKMFGNKLIPIPSVSKHDNEPTRISTPTSPKKEESSDTLFWRNQVYTIILQIFVPLIILFLINHFYVKGGATDIKSVNGRI